MEKLDFLCLFLAFGTTPEPPEYTTISESEIDLGNNLLMDTPWEATYLQLPHLHLLPGDDYLPASKLIVTADTLAVDIKSKEFSIDGFSRISSPLPLMTQLG